MSGGWGVKDKKAERLEKWMEICDEKIKLDVVFAKNQHNVNVSSHFVPSNLYQ